MARKKWCIAPSHPLVVQVAEKYRLTKKAARTILSDARRNNPALDSDDITLEFLESQDEFKDALQAYAEQITSDVNAIFNGRTTTKDYADDFSKELSKDLGVSLTEEQVEELLRRKEEIRKTANTSKVSGRALLNVLNSIKDPKHLDFFGHWICRFTSELLTGIQTSATVRRALNVQRRRTRASYLIDSRSNAADAIRQKIIARLEEAKKSLHEANELEKEQVIQAVIDNYGTLIYMYGSDIFRSEGVVVTPEATFEAPSSNTTELEQNDSSEEDENDEDISESPTNQFSSSDRNLSVTSKIAPDIKTLLSRIRELDNDGNPVMDRFGFHLHTYIDVPKAVETILTTCEGCSTLSEMITRLKARISATPWIRSLLENIDANNTADTGRITRRAMSQKEQMGSLFFKSFRKQFTRFRESYLSFDKDGYPYLETRDSNVKHGSKAKMNRLRSLYRSRKSIPIFKNKETDFNYVEKLRVNALSLVSRTLAVKQTLLKIAASNGSFADAYTEINQIADEMRSIMKDIGISIDKKTMSEYLAGGSVDPKTYYGKYSKAGDENAAARQTQVDALARQLVSTLANFSSWGKDIWNGTLDKDELKKSPFEFRRAVRSNYHNIEKLRRDFRMLVDLVTSQSPDSFESMTYINGKSYYSWNNPSTIQTIIEKMVGKNREKIREYILRKYAQDETWFVSHVDNQGNPHFYSDWLEELMYGNGSDVLQYAEKPSICGKDYGDTSDLAYGLSILMDFYTGDLGKQTAWYRMLIASDKPRYASVRFKRYSYNAKDETEIEQDFHTVIARKAVDFFVQEMTRAREVVQYAATGKGIKIKTYDLKPKKGLEKEYEAVMSKIREGKKVTTKDVVSNGRYIFRNTGAAFFLNRFIMTEIENGTKLGQAVVDRVFNPIKSPISKLSSALLTDFKTGFHSYMASVKDNYIKQMQQNGLFTNINRGGTKHAKYILGMLKQIHADENQATFLSSMYNDQEAIRTGAEKLGVDYDKIPDEEKKKWNPFYAEVGTFYFDLDDFTYNNWLAKVNMSQVFDVDLAFYGNTTDFQKRNAQVVSSGYTPNAEARIHGKLVSDGKYRSVTLKTPFVESTILENVQTALEKAATLITDPRQQRKIKANIDYTISQLRTFDSTDGQALTGLTALRKRMAHLGEWTVSDNEDWDKKGYYESQDGKKHIIYTHEAIYQRILRGEFRDDDVAFVFAQPKKPFVYAMVNFLRGNRNITVPVQNKNSEYALIYTMMYAASFHPNSQMTGIAKFLEETTKDDIKTGIDTINFDSAVKIGDNSGSVDINGLDGQQTYEALMNAVYGEHQDVGDREYKQGVVQEYDCEDYKIVQEKPEHFKHDAKQPLGSQMKILSISNIPDSLVVTLPNGKQMTGKELRLKYFSALRKKTANSERKLVRDFGLDLPHGSRVHVLSGLLKRLMSGDQRFTSELRASLSIVNRNGEDQFVLPLDEPGTQSAVESLLLSRLRKAYYKSSTFGGIVVQATSWGESEDLNVRFYSSNPADKDGLIPTKVEFARKNNITDKEQLDKQYKAYTDQYQTGYAYFEVELPMPDYVKKMLIGKDGKIDPRFINKDKTWNMEEIKKVVPESAFDAICYRTPTEAKYSMMVCKVVRFAPDGAGSVAKYPKELTVFSGSDFDIDTDFIEIRPPIGEEDEKLDNQIFDLQVAALRATSGLIETFKPGDFSDLSELSYYTKLYDAGYSEDELNKMSFDELKERCKEVEDLDLMDPYTDVLLHNQNSDAGDMIAIAAVGVTSHAFFSLFNAIDENDPERNPLISPQNFVRLNIKKKSEGFTVVNDHDPNDRISKDFEGDMIVDGLYDMDGNLIGTEISKYVGGSADAAKDAAMNRLGITRETLPIVVLMHRLGISSEVARLFVGQPVVRSIVRQMRITGAFGDDVDIDRIVRRIKTELAVKYGVSDVELDSQWAAVSSSRRELIYSDLLKGERQSYQPGLSTELQYLHIFKTLYTLGNTMRNLDGFPRYNSSKAMSGSSYIRRKAKRNGFDSLRSSLNGKNPRVKLPQDVEISDEFEPTEFGRLCSMFPYIARTILGEEEMFERIIRENMHSYGPAFERVIDKFGINSKPELIKLVYDGWKSYLLFAGPNRIADFNNPEALRYYTRDFALHYVDILEHIRTTNKPLYDRVIANNSFLNAIDTKSSKEGYADFDVLTTNIVGRNTLVVEQLQKDWADLLNYPETRQLAINIAIHFLARSAAFSNDTPVTDMPLAIKQAIPNYTNAFFDADKISFTEEQLDNFILLFCRHNAANRNFVPNYENDEDRKIADVRRNKENNSVTILFSKRSGFGRYITTENEANVSSRPVVSIDSQLYLILSEVQEAEVGEETKYIVSAIPISPLGIPNVITEYSPLFSSSSQFLDDGQFNPVPTDETFSIEDYYSEEELDTIEEGRRSGSYVYSEPYGPESVPVDTDTALTDDSYGSTRNTYLESRTHLNRIRRLVDFWGLKLGPIQRGVGTGSASTYVLNIKPNGLDEDMHGMSVAIAAIAGNLGYKLDNPVVKTYTSDKSRDEEDTRATANGIELTIHLSSVNDERFIYSTATKVFGQNVTLNSSSRELNIFIPFTDDAESTRSAISQAVKDAQVLRKTLAARGFVSSDDHIESNFVRQETLSNEDKLFVLNSIKDEQAEQLSAEPEQDQRSSEELRRDAGNEVGFSNLVELAIRRQEGEEVEQELRDLFGEQNYPFTSTGISYESRKLTDSILPALDQADVYTTVSNLLDEKASSLKQSASALLDNMIINVVNWIAGNMPRAQLMKAMQATGLKDNDATKIINVIEDKLKELNIC